MWPWQQVTEAGVKGERKDTHVVQGMQQPEFPIDPPEARSKSHFEGFKCQKDGRIAVSSNNCPGQAERASKHPGAENSGEGNIQV